MNLRYWDGTEWTDHVQPRQSPPASAPTQPASDWVVPPSTESANPTTPITDPNPPVGPGPSPDPHGPGFAYPPQYQSQYPAYTPQTSALTASGMRPIADLFNDAGRILRRAWWQITLVSLAVWALWTVAILAVAVLVVDFGSLRRAFELLLDLPSGRQVDTIPLATQQEIQAAFEASLRVDSPVVWILVGVGATLFTILIACIQIAAVNRLSMDAASGQPVSIGAAWGSGLTGGRRLFGYGIIISIGVLAVGLVWVAALALTNAVPALFAIILVIGYLAMMALFFYVFTKLVPMGPQAVVSSGAMVWSWQATHGKFWAVLGRYLLWSLVAGFVTNIVFSVLFFPIGLFASAGMTTGDPATAFMWMMVITLVSVPLSLALSALTMIGIVPIWRDLTADPIYRAIGPDGIPVPRI